MKNIRYIAHSSYFKQAGGHESRRLATEGSRSKATKIGSSRGRSRATEIRPRISRSISHGLTRKNTEGKHTSFRAGSSIHPLGARPKGSNGVVAVGLPHRNYSVFKQAHIN